jgi:hypothetical protein
MQIDQDTLNRAIQFLVDGRETEAANLLSTCEVESWDIVDSWMDGNRQLDGILIELGCPRRSYEILTDESNPLTKSVEQALVAIFPSGVYLKGIRTRAVALSNPAATPAASSLGGLEMKELIQAINAQKALMIAVATGGPRIKDVNREYGERRMEIKDFLARLSIEDPNPYPDLWTWYGKWSDGSLPTYQSRRTYIISLYQPLLDAPHLSPKAKPLPPPEPTGWVRVDRNVDKIVRALETARNGEDFQAIGLLCREAMISLAQAVYDPELHTSQDGVTPSETDAKRMLENYTAKELSGSPQDAHRKFTRSLYELAVKLQHRRSAEFRDAALCAEATRSLINAIAIISGQRDPDK